MRLENWSVISNATPYTAPELARQYLHGQVFGNPKFSDGVTITTSAIKRRDTEDAVVTRSGSHYLLGVVDPAYEAVFPDAKQRLISSLPYQPQE